MRLLGFEISFSKALPVPTPTQPGSWMGNWWWPIVREPFTGAWQRNMETRVENVLNYWAVYACVTLIATDISKLRIKLVEQNSEGVWTETKSAAFTPVLTKPNRYQNRIKFFEQWLQSKLIHGNTYVLKGRDERNVVVRMYILDPTRTKPLVAPDGSVFYELRADNLSGIQEDTVTVPASEIIHDPNSPLYHPLCGVSPITACWLAASQGLSIQRNSNTFFDNGSRPGGVLSAPGEIHDETARRLKEHWDNNYSGANAGKVAVLGDGLKYEAMSVNAVDAQLIEQLKLTAEMVASCFHVPAYMIGAAPTPPYNNIEALNQQYYNQCLQGHIENIELSLDEGLGLTEVVGKTYGTEFETEELLRMDTKTKVDSAGEMIRAGIRTINETRVTFGLPAVEGGDTCYLQQQMFSLEALAERDKNKPFAKPAPAPAAAPAPPAGGEDNVNDSRTYADKIHLCSRHYVLVDGA